LALTDNDIVLELRNSNELVFETLFRDYYERLCNYANTFLNDIDEAEELVQNTFVSFWEKREAIEIHTSVKSYLYKIVHNNCLNRIKHEKVKQDYGNDYRYVAPDGFDNATQQLIGKELEQEINRAIETLPPQCRQVFKLSRFENLTYAEIAEQLDVSVKTIENHMVKALKIMREELKDYLPTLIWILWFKMN
jgi:RNA polymerase sigma-70 factor, ECF subfamily